MTITNKHVKRSRISEVKFREFVRYFSLDLDAHQITFLTGLNLNTVNRYLLLIRKRIAEFCEQSSPFQGEIEVDESYFGAKRIKGKRGRGAYNKTPVFGLLQRGGNLEIFYTLKEAKTLIEKWRMEYNTVRPHSSLN